MTARLSTIGIRPAGASAAHRPQPCTRPHILPRPVRLQQIPACHPETVADHMQREQVLRTDFTQSPQAVHSISETTGRPGPSISIASNSQTRAQSAKPRQPQLQPLPPPETKAAARQDSSPANGLSAGPHAFRPRKPGGPPASPRDRHPHLGICDLRDAFRCIDCAFTRRDLAMHGFLGESAAAGQPHAPQLASGT